MLAQPSPPKDGNSPKGDAAFSAGVLEEFVLKTLRFFTATTY